MKEVSVRIEHVFDYELKAKFTKEMYANIAVNISSEEISDSEFQKLKVSQLKQPNFSKESGSKNFIYIILCIRMALFC